MAIPLGPILQQAFFKIRMGMNRAREICETLENSLPVKQIHAIGYEALHDVEPMIRNIVANNLSSAGLKDHTGKLKNAIAASTVGLTWAKNKPRIFVVLPKNLAPYPNKSKPSSMYKSIMALSYGAVHNPGDVNAKWTARRKRERTKAKAFSLSHLEAGRYYQKGRGQATITRAWREYQFRPQQEYDIERQFVKAFQTRFAKAMGAIF